MPQYAPGFSPEKTYAPGFTPESSIDKITRFWRSMSEPVTKKSPELVEFEEKFARDYPVIGGTTRFLGDLAFGMTSPINAAFGAAGLARSTAMKLGWPLVSKAATGLIKGLSVPLVLEGGENLIQGETWPETIGGGIELIGGLAGLSTRFPSSKVGIKSESTPAKAPEASKRSRFRRVNEEEYAEALRVVVEKGKLNFDDLGRDPANVIRYANYLSGKSKTFRLTAPIKESEVKLAEEILGESKPEIKPEVQVEPAKLTKIGKIIEEIKSDAKAGNLEAVEALNSSDRNALVNEIKRRLAKTTPPRVETPISSVKLPRELQGARPRFNFGSDSYEPLFESDIDKALFIIAQKTRSRRNADYLTFVMNHTGLDEASAMEAGRYVRTAIKGIVRNQPSGPIKIPPIWKPRKKRAPLSQRIKGETGAIRLGGEGPPLAGVPLTPGQKLVEAIRTARPLREQQETIYSAERGRRFEKFRRTRTKGERGAILAMKKLEGEIEKIEGSSIREALTQSDVDELFNSIKSSKILTEGDKASGFRALWKLLEGKGVPQRHELQVLEEVFGNNIASQIIELHGGLGSAGMVKLAKTANTMKTMRSMADLSFPLRQGLGLIHKKQWWTDALPAMIRSLGSKEEFMRMMHDLEARPNYLIGKEAGLELTTTRGLLNREEAFLDNYLGMPGLKQTLGKVAEVSERAYVGFGNVLRARVFDDLLEQSINLGNDPEITAKAIAKFVNAASGRGDLGRLGKYGEELNILLFSPRLIASRLQAFSNPFNYSKLDKFSRQEAIKSLFAIASSGLIISNLYRLAGAEIEYNPLSTDLSKPRFDRLRIDPYGGLQQYVVAATRFLVGRKADEGQGAYRSSRFDIAKDFITNKLSPLASLAYNLLTAKPDPQGKLRTRFGEELNIPAAVGESFVPLFIKDMNELIENDPSFAKLIGVGVPTMLGQGMQIYDRESALGFRRLRVN